MEMKRGNIQADEVTKQLRAGAAFAEWIVPSGTGVRFRPVMPIRCKAPLARVLR